MEFTVGKLPLKGVNQSPVINLIVGVFHGLKGVLYDENQKTNGFSYAYLHSGHGFCRL